jgi:septum formation protein
VGPPLAFRGDLEGKEDRVSPVPIVLASTSPQRRAILGQLRIPFDVAAPSYEERDRAGVPPIELVKEHARGKARSVAARGVGGRPVLGVDTAVVCSGRIFGKPGEAAEAREMLRALAGRDHAVMSGLCLVGDGWEEVGSDVTTVVMRSLSERDLDWYVSTEEWRDRAGAYAIQGLGAALIERIDGDYLNVVGLPAALLVRVLAARFPGSYGFG